MYEPSSGSLQEQPFMMYDTLKGHHMQKPDKKDFYEEEELHKIYKLGALKVAKVLKDAFDVTEEVVTLEIGIHDILWNLSKKSKPKKPMQVQSLEELKITIAHVVIENKHRVLIQGMTTHDASLRIEDLLEI